MRPEGAKSAKEDAKKTFGVARQAWLALPAATHSAGSARPACSRNSRKVISL
jgi:hypothetical protein